MSDLDLYELLKNLISKNYFSTEDMKNKLNIFLLYNQITDEQYAELMNMVSPPINTSTTETSPSSPSDTSSTTQTNETTTTSTTVTS